MPERIAATDPYNSITQSFDSGPMRFRRDEWVVGASAAFERFRDYPPRPEPASWLAGGKRIGVDRIKWVTMPDAATASAALQNGEVDWWKIRSGPGPDAETLQGRADRHRQPARQRRLLPPQSASPPRPAARSSARRCSW